MTPNSENKRVWFITGASKGLGYLRIVKGCKGTPEAGDGSTDSADAVSHMPDGQAYLGFGFRVKVPVLVAGNGNTLPAQGIDLIPQLLAGNVEGTFQLPADDGVFRTVVILAQMLCKLFFLHGFSFPAVSPERQKRAQKNRAASCMGNRPCFDVGSKKAQASLPALLDYAKLS